MKFRNSIYKGILIVNNLCTIILIIVITVGYDSSLLLKFINKQESCIYNSAKIDRMFYNDQIFKGVSKMMRFQWQSIPSSVNIPTNYLHKRQNNFHIVQALNYS